MARTFAGLCILGFAVVAFGLLGSAVLNRRWNREGFYE